MTIRCVMQRAVLVGQKLVDGFLRKRRRGRLEHLHALCGAGKRASDGGAVPVDGPTLRIVGRRKARIAVLDARQIGHPLEDRQALRVVGQQRGAKAQEELDAPRDPAPPSQSGSNTHWIASFGS